MSDSTEWGYLLSQLKHLLYELAITATNFSPSKKKHCLFIIRHLQCYSTVYWHSV